MPWGPPPLQPTPAMPANCREISIHLALSHPNVIGLASAPIACLDRVCSPTSRQLGERPPSLLFPQYCVLEDDDHFLLLLEHAEGGDLWKDQKKRRGIFR